MELTGESTSCLLYQYKLLMICCSSKMSMLQLLKAPCPHHRKVHIGLVSPQCTRVYPMPYTILLSPI